MRIKLGRSPDSRSTVACRAPFDSLHLDQFGDARACCQSNLVLGNARDQSIAEIWNGDAAGRLRSAVAAGDLSVGCTFCEWAVRKDGPEVAYARKYDDLRGPEGDAGPARTSGPAQLELALSNSCNLQCTMCNGDFSSSIRTHRENRPPLPAVYEDDFFEELAEVLAGVDKIEMLGGEPLLGKEPLRVMDLLAAHAPDASVNLTTNATVWSPRVERLLKETHCSFVVSLDGASAETYESIRVGAQWPVVLETLERLRELTDEKGTRLVVAHCLMLENWHEFADLLALAARFEAPVFVNTVIDPPASSLYHLLPVELNHVIRTLKRREDEVATLGDPWLTVWTRELKRLSDNLDESMAGSVGLRVGGGGDTGEPASRLVAETPSTTPEAEVSALLEQAPEARITRLEFDSGFRVESVLVAQSVADVPENDPTGETLRAILHPPADSPGHVIRAEPALMDEEWLVTEDGAAFTRRRVVMTGPDGRPTVLLAVQRVAAESTLLERIARLAGGVDDVVTLETDTSDTVQSVLPSAEASLRIGLDLSPGVPAGDIAARLDADLGSAGPSIQVETLDWVTHLVRVRVDGAIDLEIASRMLFDGSTHTGNRSYLAARPQQ